MIECDCSSGWVEVAFAAVVGITVIVLLSGEDIVRAWRWRNYD